MADSAALDAFKSLGKAVGQMALYKVGHPAVNALIEEAARHLTAALGQVSGELVFTADGDKLIADGRVIGSLKDLPGGLGAAFQRLKLASVSFKAGTSHDDLAAFCELAAPRPSGAPAVDPARFLAERGVSRIALNEALYTKTHPKLKVAAAAGAVDDLLTQSSVDQTLAALIARAVPDPAQRSAVLERVMGLLKQDIERRISEVTADLSKEKDVLKNEQERTTNVLSNFVEGVVMVDEEGKILMMNAAAEQLYGATLAEMAGSPLTAKAGEEHVVTLSADLGTPTAAPKDVKVAGDEDVRRTMKQAGAVVQNVDGKVVGMVTQLPDVAKHKELTRMQRDFVSHVTHELRAPLASIKAALEILQGEMAGKIREDENRILSTAIKNSDRLAELINTILDFSKLESGQMAVFPKPDDPEKITRDAVDALAAWAAKKRLALSLISADKLPPVNADHQRTVQVLVNLISNAIKFTPVAGSITVRVAADEKAVRFSVTDTGPGVEKKDQGRIFEKFQQTTSGAAAGGTGLGLTIAKALIEMQGGRIWVESEPGKGATFLFTLPIHTGKEATPSAEKRKAGWIGRILGG